MLFIGLLSARRSLLRKAARDLADAFGPIEAVSPLYPFDHSEHYDAELGGPPFRRFLFFANRIDPSRLATIKRKTNALEGRWTRKVGGAMRRGVNLDPGTLSLHQVVLATTKNYAHRIYLRSGIYAELELVYRKGGNGRAGRYAALEHTYPDFASPECLDLFGEVRNRYLAHSSPAGPSPV